MRIKEKEIQKYKSLYADDYYDEEIEIEAKRWLQGHEYLTKEMFLKIGRWKTKRQLSNYKKNDEELIKEISRISFSSKNEQLKISVLTLLRGVNFPVASVILHFKYPDLYPILDFRVLYSLGWDKPSVYNFDYWWRYVLGIRGISKRLNIPIRELDKALWAYSKFNQKVGR